MRLILFILLTLNLALLKAQEDSSATGENETAKEEQVNPEESGEKFKYETPDTFEATEKLSEDVSAPFPVDI